MLLVMHIALLLCSIVKLDGSFGEGLAPSLVLAMFKIFADNISSENQPEDTAALTVCFKNGVRVEENNL